MFRLILAWFVYTWGGLHRYFGNTNSMRSEHEKAVRCFNRAQAIDPSWRRLRLERAKILWRELQRYEEALADLNWLLAEDPVDGPALLNRALVYQESGRYQEALSDLESYLTLPEESHWHEATRIAEQLRVLIQTGE